MIEELKLIIEMLGGIQEDAYTLVVAYFSFMLLQWAVTAGAIIYFFHFVATKGAGFIRDALLVTELRDTIDPTRAGYSVNKSDLYKIRLAARQHKEKN